MVLSKILSKYQITLPKQAVQALGLHKGDILKCTIERGRVAFSPVVVDELYSDADLQSFERLYNDPKNKGKAHRSKAAAMEHLKKLQ